MYRLKVYRPNGEFIQQTNMNPIALAQWVLQANLAGMEYDGAMVEVRLADAGEPTISIDRLQGWIEQYLGLSLAECCG